MTGLPDYAEALARALTAVREPGPAETAGLAEADGRVLRETLRADRDLPPFDRAQMDGYALRAADYAADRTWPVVGTVPAGRDASIDVPTGACVAIATGAPLPAGVDAVIPHEESDRGDPVRFTCTSVSAGRAVHPRGADARAGDRLLEPGVVLAPPHVGLAAALGRTEVTVTRRPRAVVLTSGDEVRGAGEPVAPHQIRNSNGPQTVALLARLGAGPVAHRHVADEAAPTMRAVAEAIAGADLLVTIGGISAGTRDHFPAAFDAAGVERVVHGAAIQPGKPVIVGAAPSGTIIVGLPGNPVSSLACACLFAWPIVRAWSGTDPALPWRTVTLTAAVRPNPRRQAFRPAALAADGDGAAVPAWAGSGDLAHVRATDGLVALPIQDGPVPAGARLRFLRWP